MSAVAVSVEQLHVLLLLQSVSDAHSSSKCRHTMLVNKCLYQLSKSDSGTAACTERCNGCNYVLL
jgi:hypothetical protein